VYARRAAARRAEQAEHERRSGRFGVGRLVSFAAAAVLTVLAFRAAGGAQRAEGALAGGLWIVFVALVVGGSRAAAKARRARALATLNDQGGFRVRRAWDEITEQPWPAPAADHPFANDLDVFGPASLAKLFPPLSAAPGRSTLAAWLLGAPGVEAEHSMTQQLAERQAAVADLAPREDLRDELALLASSSRGGEAALTQLRAWAVTPPWLSIRPAVRVQTVIIPLVTIALLVAQFRGIAGPWWLLSVAWGMVLTRRYRAALRASLDAVTEQAAALRHFATTASLLQAERFDSAFLRRTGAALGERDAGAALLRLRAIADWAETRHSPLVHAVLHAVTLWDFHLVRRLERWRAQFGDALGGWLDMIGETEAAAALATVAHDNPDWRFPTRAAAGADAALRATSLGHPLIAASVRVANDVTVGPRGTLLLVTGSNMAGKSTLLRAIGLNTVLAQAGGPVCARTFESPRVRLYTSIRVQDSLERGVSYFMAELQRLKLIADAAATGDEAPVLYLLDEMLHGTNSVERAVAARRILTQLIDRGAIGAVTTHDLALGDGPPLADAARQVHFTEQFSRVDGRPVMSFDYLLRPGKATSTNALKLLELVGLD